MINYLVDTDWVIDYLNGKEEIIEKLTALQEKGLAISVISLSELYDGVYGSKNYKIQMEGLDNFLEGIIVLEVNEEIAKIFGKERATLRKSGKIIGNFDLIIAATCLYYDLNLLTNNLKHFDMIEGLRIGTKSQ